MLPASVVAPDLSRALDTASPTICLTTRAGFAAKYIDAILTARLKSGAVRSHQLTESAPRRDFRPTALGVEFCRFTVNLPSLMPRDTSLRKILLIGSGPIVIGQGCEFDYSGVQACKALAEEGYTVVLINSNPATIMTDPEFAHRTYIEPITPEIVDPIIAKERPDALLPTLGGQTALNTAMQLS